MPMPPVVPRLVLDEPEVPLGMELLGLTLGVDMVEPEPEEP